MRPLSGLLAKITQCNLVDQRHAFDMTRMFCLIEQELGIKFPAVYVSVAQAMNTFYIDFFMREGPESWPRSTEEERCAQLLINEFILYKEGREPRWWISCMSGEIFFKFDDGDDPPVYVRDFPTMQDHQVARSLSDLIGFWLDEYEQIVVHLNARNLKQRFMDAGIGTAEDFAGIPETELTKLEQTAGIAIPEIIKDYARQFYLKCAPVGDPLFAPDKVLLEGATWDQIKIYRGNKKFIHISDQLEAKEKLIYFKTIDPGSYLCYVDQNDADPTIYWVDISSLNQKEFFCDSFAKYLFQAAWSVLQSGQKMTENEDSFIQTWKLYQVHLMKTERDGQGG